MFIFLCRLRCLSHYIEPHYIKCIRYSVCMIMNEKMIFLYAAANWEDVSFLKGFCRGGLRLRSELLPASKISK